MALAGHGCTVKITGTAVSVTAEATTNLDAGVYTKYRVSLAARRVIDPASAYTVKVNGGGVAGSTYTIDFANGIVKFSSALIVTDVVTIDYYYLPLLSIAETREFSISCMRTMLENTSFDSSGVKTRLAGLGDASGSLTHLTVGSDDLDPGAGSRKLHDVLTNNTLVALEFAFTGAAEGQTFRALVGLSGIDDKVSVDGLFEETVNWQAGGAVATALITTGYRLWGFDDGRTL